MIDGGDLAKRPAHSEKQGFRIFRIEQPKFEKAPDLLGNVWLGGEGSNLRMGESKSARTLSDINAHSEYAAESAPTCINRLAEISEWTTTKLAVVGRLITEQDKDGRFVGY
jgi:hypothetical protein